MSKSYHAYKHIYEQNMIASVPVSGEARSRWKIRFYFGNSMCSSKKFVHEGYFYHGLSMIGQFNYIIHDVK